MEAPRGGSRFGEHGRRLEELERLEPRLAKVVECKFFGGMAQAEIGKALGVTDRTVRRDWQTAKGWLAHFLAKRSS